jgi:hypothetical protein
MTTFAKSQTPFGRPAFSWTLSVICMSYQKLVFLGKFLNYE